MTKEEINASIDKALGLTPDVIAEIEAIVRETYPGRSDATIQRILVRAKDLWIADEPELTRGLIVGLGAIEPTLTRATPSVADVVSFKEAEAKRLGLKWTAVEKLAAHRTAVGLDADARLEAVPATHKLEPAAKKETPVATPMNQTDVLDQMVLERYGKTKHEISAMDRRRYHDALRPELDKTDKRSAQVVDNARAQQDAGRPLDPAAKIAAFRAAQKLKTG